MIKVNISKENKQQDITAAGSVPEILTDVAMLISSIYTQFKNVDPDTAEKFRSGLVNMVQDPNGPAWKAWGNQTGIIFQRPEQDGREG